MDPQHKLLLQCTYRALEDAGIPMEKASGTRTGVFLGNIQAKYKINKKSLLVSFNPNEKVLSPTAWEVPTEQPLVNMRC